MAIIDTEAVVLSSIAQGETSKIVRLLTQNYGRVTVIAKGSRSWKNRFGSSLDTLNYVHVIFYHKENRDLQILQKCDTIDPFPKMRSDLDKLALVFSIAEILQGQFVEEEENIPMFRLVVQSLKAIDATVKNYINIYWNFLIQFLRISGFEINMELCRICNIEVDEPPAFFSRKRGGVICGNCASGEAAQKLSGDVLQILRYIQRTEFDSLPVLAVSGKTGKEIADLFDGYFRFHFEGYTTPQALKLSG